MKKRILSLALVLMLCLGMSVPALAADSATVGQVNTISLGFNGLAVVDANGTLWVSDPDYQDLGLENRGTSPVFTKIMENVRTVSCEASEYAVVKTDGSLWTFGHGYYDKNYNYIKRFTSKKIMDGVVSVSASNDTYDTYAAIKEDGSLWMWGGNLSGQLGNGTTNDSAVPVRVLENVVAVSCDSSNTAAIKKDGSLWMWGAKSGLCNEYYDGDSLQTVPIKIMENVRSVNCGGHVTTIVKTDGSLWVWGFNASGQMANGSAGWDTYKTPCKVMDNVVSVGNNLSVSAAVKADGSLWMWGENDCGNVGNGYSGTDYSTQGIPYQLTPCKVLDSVAAVTCGSLSVAAVKTDGSVWFWGRSSYLNGIGNDKDPYDFAMQTTPVQLKGITAKISSSASTSKPTPTPTPSVTAEKVGGFSDVVKTDYFADSVLWAVDKGITAGTSKTTFSPNSTCTTAQILTFLWRSQGSPEPTSKTNTFTDIKESDYFYKAALWAKENNIVSRDSTVFNGNTPYTRSSAVLYIWRATGFPVATKSSSFTDVATTTIYAPAVDWAVEQGVTSGTSKTTFSPDTTCTRAQIVTFLYRAFSK